MLTLLLTCILSRIVLNVTSVLCRYLQSLSHQLPIDMFSGCLGQIYKYIYIYILNIPTRKQGKSNFLEYSTVKFNLVVSIDKTLCFKLIVQRPRWHLVQYTFSSNNLYTIKTRSYEYNIKYIYLIIKVVFFYIL